MPVLYPVQQVVLKLLREEELDNTTRCIPVTPRWLSRPIEVTEAEYLGFLYDDGRSTVGHQELFEEFYLAAGRRSGKSLIGSHFLAGKAEELVRSFNLCLPLVSPSTIAGLLFATHNMSVAKLAKETFHQVYQESLVLQRATGQETNSSVGFHTLEDLFTGDTEYTKVRAIFRSTQAKSLRGSMFYAAVFDEAAYTRDLQLAYNAVHPAVRSTKGKLCMLSSPNGTKDLFASKVQGALDADLPGVLALQIPTWEMVPHITEEQCREWAGTEWSFRTEFKAEFLDRGDAE